MGLVLSVRKEVVNDPRAGVHHGDQPGDKGADGDTAKEATHVLGTVEPVTSHVLVKKSEPPALRAELGKLHDGGAATELAANGRADVEAGEFATVLDGLLLAPVDTLVVKAEGRLAVAVGTNGCAELAVEGDASIDGLAAAAAGIDNCAPLHLDAQSTEYRDPGEADENGETDAPVDDRADSASLGDLGHENASNRGKSDPPAPVDASHAMIVPDAVSVAFGIRFGIQVAPVLHSAITLPAVEPGGESGVAICVDTGVGLGESINVVTELDKVEEVVADRLGENVELVP